MPVFELSSHGLMLQVATDLTCCSTRILKIHFRHYLTRFKPLFYYRLGVNLFRITM